MSQCIIKPRVAYTAIVVCLTIISPSSIAWGPSIAWGQRGSTNPPDFTRGDIRPKEATHDWLLGPTGARGWIYCDQMVTSDARQILVTKVEEESPAEGVLEVGDVILGVNGSPFSEDPRTEFGKAISEAESDHGANGAQTQGHLRVIRWRSGTEREVAIPIPLLGTYSAAAP